MDIKKILKNHFAKEKDVLCVYLFGSAARGRENRFSDVDIAVLFDDSVPQESYTERCLSIMGEISSLLDKNVDVIALNKASSFLKFQIIKNGLRVYERPGRAKRRFEARAITEYFDFLPVRRRMEAGLMDNIRRGGARDG